MSIFDRRPNIDKLKKKSKINALIKSINYKKDKDIRGDAIKALGDLNVKKAIDPIIDNLLIEKDDSTKRISIKVLDKLGWYPEHNDKVAAIYWYYKGEYEKCASCGNYAIELLINRIFERDYDVIESFISIGPSALEYLISTTNAIFNYYKNFTSSIHELNFMRQEDHIKSKQIEKYVDILSSCIYTIGKFNMPLGEKYLILLYNMVKESIYSHPAGGFSDMFKAIDVRENIVSSIGSTFSGQGIQFLIGVLENEPSYFVRWRAVDVLDKIAEKSLNDIKNERVVKALNIALQNDPDGVSSRKGKINNILEKIRNTKI